MNEGSANQRRQVLAAVVMVVFYVNLLFLGEYLLPLFFQATSTLVFALFAVCRVRLLHVSIRRTLVRGRGNAVCESGVR